MNLAKEGFFLPLTHLLFSVQGTWNSTNSCLQGKNTKKLSLSKVWCEKQEIDLCYYRNTAFFHQTFVSKSKALVFQFWCNTISGTDFSHQTHSFLVTFFLLSEKCKELWQRPIFLRKPTNSPLQNHFWAFFLFWKRPENIFARNKSKNKKVKRQGSLHGLCSVVAFEFKKVPDSCRPAIKARIT